MSEYSMFQLTVTALLVFEILEIDYDAITRLP